VKKLLLIDGDEFIFRATAAVEHESRWDDQNHTIHANENKAWDTLTGMINRVFERFETKEHILCFSQAPNFRFTVDPTYKNNRAASRKPICYALMREWVDEKYKTKAFPGLEADDVMGILATQPGKSQRIIVSQDKDMKTIPTTVWDGKDLRTITEAEADHNHLYQTLIGDTSDGYAGCPGVGPVAAEEFLDNPFVWEPYEHTFKSGPRKGLTEQRWKPEPTDDVWKGVVSHYVKAGLTEENAITQARLARILRWSDWDGVKKQPILWSPTT
jgi:DNA polymerase-1